MEFHFIYPDNYTLIIHRKKYKKLEDSISKKDHVEIFERLKSILNSHINFEEFALLHGINLEKCKACKTHFAKYELIDYDLKFQDFFIVNFHNAVKYKTDVRYCHRGKNSQCPASNMNPNSANFYSMTMGISESEALKYLKSKNKSPFYRENFNLEEDYKKNQKRDLDFFQRKYGEKNGLEKFNEFIEKIQYSLSKEQFESRHGKGSYEKYCKSKDSYSIDSFLKRGFSIEEANTKRQEIILKSRCSLESFILRHGEKSGSEKYLNFTQKKSYQMTENFYTQKFGKIQGKKIWRNKRETFSNSLEKFILKHGEEKGIEIYEKWVTGKGGLQSFSGESIKFMEEFIELEKCYYGKNELRLWDPFLKRIFFYDFYFPEKKLVVEYDTPFCHPNPDFMNEKEFYNWSNPFIMMNPEEKYKIDQRKEELLKEKGYKFHRCYIRNKEDELKHKEIIKKLL